MSLFRLLVRGVAFCTFFGVMLTAVGIIALLQSKEFIFDRVTWNAPEPIDTTNPFPVGVDPVAGVITESEAATSYYEQTLAEASDSRNHWWNQAAAVLSGREWFQNLASPVSRIVVIWPGQRKEEAVKQIGDILRWNDSERTEFEELVSERAPGIAEGKFYPGQYVTHRYATPADIADILDQQFTTEVLDRYTDEVRAQVPLTDALIIASLLEREASDFTNMREVSGVIWNRLFIEMPLQLDATLQYVRGSDPYEPAWWPAVRPRDKFIESPFNTYENRGLPPTPIANPSAEAILAALNPVQTDCLYYFHSRSREYYCSETYEAHVEKLRTVYGRGR